MSNYYLFGAKNAAKGTSAFAPTGTKLDHELIPELDNKNELPFELNLVMITVTSKGLKESNDLSDLNEIWDDYEANSLAWPLMSEKLKSLIERYLTGNEGIDWIRAKVNGNGEQRIYYIPRFSQKLDVLDTEKTLYIEGTDQLLRPCYSLQKISKYSVFHRPSSKFFWKITSALYVSEELKKAIQKEKITGVEFEKARVA